MLRRSLEGHGWVIAVFIISLLGGAIGIWWINQIRPRPELVPPPTWTAEEVAELQALKDLGVARLEDGPATVDAEGGGDNTSNRTISALEVSADAFVRLRGRLTEELLPVQNLAICRWMIYEAAQENSAELREAAEQAVKSLLRADPDSTVAPWLLAKIGFHRAPDDVGVDLGPRRSASVRALRTALQRHQDDPLLWYTLYEATQFSREPGDRATAAQALAKAAELLPDNLYVLSEWLVHQTRAQDSDVGQTLLTIGDLVRPIEPRVEERTRGAWQTMLRDARAAAAAGDFTTLTPLAFRIQQTAIRPDSVSKSDMKEVKPHPLEFVMYEFSNQNLQRPPRTGPGKIDLKLSETQLELPGASAEPRDLLVADFDLNGYPDVWVLEDQRLVIYGRSQPTEAWSVLSEVALPAGMVGLVAADLDRDRLDSPRTEANQMPSLDNIVPAGVSCHESDMDIVVYGQAGIRVIENHLDEEGARVLKIRETDELAELSAITEVLLVDIDHDYDLDLIACGPTRTSIWLSLGAYTFADVSDASLLPPSDTGLHSLVAVDVDRDVDIDILAVDTNGRLGYLENLLHRRLRWQALPSGFPQYDKVQAVTVLEADGNASWDLAVAHANGISVWRTSTVEPGRWRFAFSDDMAQEVADELLMADMDNDGFQDCWAKTADGLLPLRAGSATIWEAARSWVNSPLPAGAFDVEDLDLDGDLDLVAGGDSLRLYDNVGGNRNNWIRIYPLGRDDNAGRCNRNAIGSLVELKAASGYQARVVGRQVVHFGLGQDPDAEVIRFLWTNGVPQSELGVAKNVGICEKMELKGSCPFVYTWTGSSFEFLTDCLWGAPIGMQVAEGVLAPSRSWEYLRIPGERMVARDGRYEILLTEELWEAAYFDQVRLLAVDHPPDLEIYNNEKVGPPDVTEHRIFAVRHPRPVAAAHDSQGVEWSQQLAAVDGSFAQPFSERIRQGLTPKHFLELDLGEVRDPAHVVLFLTGWILPTDTSLNVGFSQEPDLQGPVPPSLWVADAEGHWQQVMPSMGFPGGKTKTITVDLSNRFLCDDYRIRIETSAEIYWDQAFFTDGEMTDSWQVTTCPLDTASLDYRGFSRALPEPPRSPRRFDAGRIDKTPKWPPMEGHFTRYGDVLPLLQGADDQLVVIGAGDAIRVRFQAPPLKAGWKRDFLLYSIGWDKDADLNTYFGQSSEPLPFRAMTEYPYGMNDVDLMSQSYQDYLRTYQTRPQQPARFWRQLVPRAGRP